VFLAPSPLTRRDHFPFLSIWSDLKAHFGLKLNFGYKRPLPVDTGISSYSEYSVNFSLHLKPPVSTNPRTTPERCPFQSVGAKPKPDAKRHRIGLGNIDKEFIVDMGPPIGGVVVGGELQHLG